MRAGACAAPYSLLHVSCLQAELVAAQAQHAQALAAAQQQARAAPLDAGDQGASGLDMGGDGTIAAAFASLIAEVESAPELPPPAGIAATSAAGGATGVTPSPLMPPPPPAVSASSSVTVTVAAANPVSTSLTSAGLPGPAAAATAVNSGSSYSGSGDPGLLLRFQPMIDTPTLSSDLDGSPPHINGLEAPMSLHRIPNHVVGQGNSNGNGNGALAPAAVPAAGLSDGMASRPLPFQSNLMGLGGAIGAGGVGGAGAGGIGGPASAAAAAAASGLSEMRLRLEAVAARPGALSMAPPGVGLGGTSLGGGMVAGSAGVGQKRPRMSVSWAAEQQRPQQLQPQQRLLGAALEAARPQPQGWEPWLQGLAQPQPQQAPLPLQLPLQAPQLMPQQALAGAGGMDVRGPSPGPSRSGGSRGTETGVLGLGADVADGDSGRL